jgi:hypothetical protein
MPELWWGLACLAVSAVLAIPAVRLVRQCETRGDDADAPVGWAIWVCWLSTNYLLLGTVMVADYFWPMS